MTAGTGSKILGNVVANGQVWIIDPNGVTVNAGAVFDVGGLLLSSASWGGADRANFLAGGTSWSFTGAYSPIVMNGVIIANGGVVALLGPSVSIGGSVSASNTQLLAVAAKDVSLGFDGSGTYFTLSGVSIGRGADGGQVSIGSGAQLTADRIVVASVGATAAASIVVGASVTATSARSDGADIVLLAADGTDPDASLTARTVLSGGAVASLVAGAKQGSVDLSSGGVLGAAAGVLVGANGQFNVAGNVSATTVAVYAPTLFGGGAISSSGAQTWFRPVLLRADTSLTALTVGFRSTVDGPYGLSVAGAAVFDAPVGAASMLSSLSVSGTSSLDGGAVTTLGGQFYGGAVTLAADTRLTGGLVQVDATLDGAHALNVNGSGSFNGAVGALQPLASFSATGPSMSFGGSVTTIGALTIDALGRA